MFVAKLAAIWIRLRGQCLADNQVSVDSVYMETSHDAWIYKFHVECMLTRLGDSFIYLDTTWGITLVEFGSRVFSKSPGYTSDFRCFRNHMALFVASCHMKICL